MFVTFEKLFIKPVIALQNAIFDFNNHSRDSKFQIKVFVLKTYLFLVTWRPEHPGFILDTKRFKISWTKISHFDLKSTIDTVLTLVPS